jgi:NPCBM-associated, NEW3 domain of alpha-galactosidase
MTRGTIITTIAAMSSRPVVITFSTLLSLLLFLPIIFVPDIANGQDTEGSVQLNLTADRVNISNQNRIGMNLVVMNMHKTEALTLISASLLLPDGWNTTGDEILYTTLTTIPPNSAKIIRFNFTVPQTAFEGDYEIYGRLAAVQTLNISEVDSANIHVTKSPVPLATDIRWDSIYLLFLVYTIPGAAIERLIEALRYIIIPNATEGDALAKSNRLVIDKLKTFTLPDFKRETLDNWRDLLKHYEKVANSEESKVKLGTWFGAFFIALFPSYFLMAYNLSLLTIMGYSDPNAEIADVIIGAMIIAFVTKPTHEAIVTIEKLRGLKKLP